MAPSGGIYPTSVSSGGLLVVTAIASTVAALAAASQIYQSWRAREKHQSRFKWVQAEIEAQNAKTPEENEDQVLPSIIAHFTDFQLDYGATVGEANKKRVRNFGLSVCVCLYCVCRSWFPWNFVGRSYCI